LENRFDEIFTQKTDYQMLNLALKRLYENFENQYPNFLRSYYLLDFFHRIKFPNVGTCKRRGWRISSPA